MKQREQLEAFRKEEPAVIEKQIAELERELMNLRFKHSSGQLEKTGELGKVRKKISRAKTVLKEKQVQ